MLSAYKSDLRETSDILRLLNVNEYFNSMNIGQSMVQYVYPPFVRLHSFSAHVFSSNHVCRAESIKNHDFVSSKVVCNEGVSTNVFDTGVSTHVFGTVYRTRVH